MTHPPSTTITAAGIDHVRLSYAALDAGDLDAYASLLDADVQLNRPDVPPANGRAETVDRLAPEAGPATRHELYKVVGAGDCITVTGRVVGRCAFADHRVDVEFAEIITISDESLILGIRRFYAVAPPPAHPEDDAGPTLQSKS